MSKKKRNAQQDNQNTRRDQFTQPPPRARLSWNTIVIAAALALLSAMVYVTRSGAGAGPRVAGDAAPVGQAFTLAVSELEDGQARFYRYTSGAGRDVRFFVMRSSDGVVRAAFDTCDVCYRERKGYRQEGSVMVCNNCNKRFQSTDINVIQGGCNPAPLERSVENGQVVVQATALEQGAVYF